MSADNRKDVSTVSVLFCELLCILSFKILKLDSVHS